MTRPYDVNRETGQICYEAFAGLLGWKWRGLPLPSWEKLEPVEQDAFRAGAHDAMQRGWSQGVEPAGKHKRSG